MKKTNILLSLLLTLAVPMTFTSCDDIQEDGFTVIKPGSLTLEASLTQKEFEYTGSEGTIKIETNTKWKASTSDTWITLLETEGAGSGDLAFSISANDQANDNRTGSITITSDVTSVPPVTLSFTQKYTSLAASTYNLMFGKEGGEQTLTISSSMEWTLINEADYLTVTPTTGDNTTVTVTCAPNTSITTRTTTLVFVSGTTEGDGVDAESNRIEVTVIQDAGTFAVSPSSLTFTSAGGRETFLITSDVDWSISNGAPSWCSLSVSEGSGNTTVELIVERNNTTRERTATINVTTKDGSDTRPVVVTQGAGTFSISSTALSIAALNGYNTFEITSDIAWSVTSVSASWCQVTPESGSGNGRIAIIADDNMAPQDRVATIVVSNETESHSVVVTQMAAPVDVKTTVVEVIYRDYSTIIVGYQAQSGTEIVEKGVQYTSPDDAGFANATSVSGISDLSSTSFSVRLTGLSVATEYLTRGYVTIEYSGRRYTFYGPMTRFTTKADPTQGDNPNPVNP